MGNLIPITYEGVQLKVNNDEENSSTRTITLHRGESEFSDLSGNTLIVYVNKNDFQYTNYMCLMNNLKYYDIQLDRLTYNIINIRPSIHMHANIYVIDVKPSSISDIYGDLYNEVVIHTKFVTKYVIRNDEDVQTNKRYCVTFTYINSSTRLIRDLQEI